VSDLEVRGSDEPSGGSAQRALRLLALVAREGRAMGLAELAQRLKLPKASAHRLCTQLVSGGWLARDVDDKSFAAGAALRRLALDTLGREQQRAQRHAVLHALVQEVGETCNFTTLDGAEVLYLDRVEASWPLRLTLDIGSHVPLHCTASGKLFLALMPATRREALLAQLAMPRLTPHTLGDAEALHAECAAIARQDYSIDREEYIAGLVAVAVPVRDREGEVRAALAVHAPTARMSVAVALERLPALQAAARRMGALL